MSTERIKEFIDCIANDKYSDGRDAIAGVVADKYNARIEGAREKLGLKLESTKKCDECGKMIGEATGGCKCEAKEEE
jgi:hypothetical protein